MSDSYTEVGNAASNGVTNAGDATQNAQDQAAGQPSNPTATPATSNLSLASRIGAEITTAIQGVRKALANAKVWSDEEGISTLDFLTGYPPNEKFPKTVSVELADNAGPPMPAQGAWAASGGSSTVSPAERSFVYLDVGRWGGGQLYDANRDFGLVCGRTAVLCAFRKGGAQPDPIPNALNRPEIDKLNALIAHLSQNGSLGPVCVRRYDTARTLLPSNSDVTPDRIYVIVGDMHLPVITSMDDTHGPRMGRIPGISNPLTGNMVDAAADEWYRYYAGVGLLSGKHDHKGADIFETAGPDLTEFVQRLEQFTAFPLHLLQLGDMIDLWIGFERFFLRSSDGMQLDTSKSDPDVNAWVNFWTDRTLNGTSQSEHVKRFLGFTNGRKNWLYGNHDNYLARCNPPSLQALCGDPRQSEFRSDDRRLFAAHGHRWDSANRDGAIEGHALTQTAFLQPLIRKVEPGGRRSTIVGAVDQFLSTESDPFCVFAMGHTHQAVLTRVRIVDVS